VGNQPRTPAAHRFCSPELAVPWDYPP
jgi:hypothetical protein